MTEREVLLELAELSLSDELGRCAFRSLSGDVEEWADRSLGRRFGLGGASIVPLDNFVSSGA